MQSTSYDSADIARTDARFIEQNDSELLEFVDENNIPWWLHVRDYFLLSFESALSGENTVTEGVRKIDLDTIRYFGRSFLDRIMQDDSKQAAIVFDVPCRYYANEEGISQNVFSDYFASLYQEKSFVFENAPLDWIWPKKRAFNKCSSTAFMWARCMGIATIQSKAALLPITYRKFIEHIAVWLKREYGPLIEGFDIVSVLKKAYVLQAASRLRGTKLLKRIGSQTQIVFIVGGIYARNSNYVMNLKRRGIIVVELQHGILSQKNVLYCPAPRIAKDKRFKASKPDYWLFYGNYWKHKTSMPCESVVIGNPYRTERFVEIEKKPHDTILLIGRAANTEQYMQWASDLEEALKEYSVLFRPHPTERNEANRLLSKYGNVRFDTDELYQSLSRTYAVIGECSTVLFEAIGIVDRILVHNSPYPSASLGSHPFEEFHTIQDLIDKLSDPSSRAISPQEFWAESWQERYCQFVSNIMEKTDF